MPDKSLPISKLTVEEVLVILRDHPEQTVFDWKRDFTLEDEKAQSELVKDLAAIANATVLGPGFVFYGVNPEAPDPIVGISRRYDDAALQQLIGAKVEPQVAFLYYELVNGARRVGVLHVPQSRGRPHIIRTNFGVVRDGQIPIRRGSSTAGISRDELFACFYGSTSPYWQSVLQHVGAEAHQLHATATYIKELREQREDLVRSMEVVAGLPPGTLTGRR